MDLASSEQIVNFLKTVGERLPVSAAIYVFGGSALLLVGGPRSTADLDYTLKAAAADVCRSVINAVAAELGVDVEENVPADFMPLPTGVDERHRLIGEFGSLTAYVFDPYSMAVMKVDRAFPSDFEDVYFLINSGQIDLAVLEKSVEDVTRRYDEPRRLRHNFEELKRGL